MSYAALMRSRALRVALLFVAVVAFSQEVSDPWPKSAIVEPADLAEALRSAATKPSVICVAFPVLYRSKHITHAVFAGPGNRPEGIEALKKAVAGMAKDSDLVVYCGCCPMTRCPNVRPAFRALKDMGFTRVRVLNLPTNTAADWYEKGYPSEAGSMTEGVKQ
jgi:thiosulfate/3-mercaptopyruvate sulfurtransferase